MWGGEGGDSLLCPCPGPHVRSDPAQITFRVWDQTMIHNDPIHLLGERKQTQTQKIQILHETEISKVRLVFNGVSAKSQPSETAGRWH